VVTPNEMIRAILGAEVDLLFFGGIGTYLRASDETDAEVGDRANDAVRLSAKMVRAKVVGEGANLGVTQRARIEFGQLGGRINTDAIDNSAGVDCSDHEVNIKILLNEVVARGDMTVKQRNTLLAGMTDDVAQLVLRDNYLQSQALSMMEAHGPDRLDEQARLIRHLERIGRLDRGIEFLPTEEELAERIAKRGVLTRPETAVVMPYCKLWLFDELIDSDLPDEAQLDPELLGYFPEALQKGFAPAIRSHRLRREIVATVIGNAMINRIGGTFLTEMIEETGAAPSDITRAFIVARSAFSLEDLWSAIEALDNQVSAAIQLGMLMTINRAVRAIVSWILRHTPAPVDIPGLSVRLKAGADALRPSRITLEPQDNEVGRFWDAAGVPDDLVRRILALEAMVSVPDVVTLGEIRNVAIPLAAAAYDRVGERFGFGWLRAQAAHLVPRTHWQKLAIGALVDDFAEQHRDVAQGVLALIGEGGGPDAVEPALGQWIVANASAVDHADRLLGEYRDSAQPPDLAMLTVAARQYRTMARS
jgi:glutamate dehydrogenase